MDSPEQGSEECGRDGLLLDCNVDGVRGLCYNSKSVSPNTVEFQSVVICECNVGLKLRSLL